MTILPAINSKLYHEIVADIIKRPFDDPERHRLSRLQRLLADAQQVMSQNKTLDAWIKAG